MSELLQVTRILSTPCFRCIANVSDDHEHEDANDIEALVEYTKVQRRIIDMYKTLHDEKKRIENVDGVIDDESECDEVLKGTEVKIFKHF